MTLTPPHGHVRPEGTPMSLTALVSYDDTSSDHDALMLARILAAVGRSPVTRLRSPRDPGARAPVRSLRSTRPAPCSSAAPAGSASGICPTRPGSSSAHRPPRACAGLPEARVPISSSSAPSTAPRPATSRPSARRRSCSTGARPRPWRSPRPVTAQTGFPASTRSACRPTSADDAALVTARGLAEHLHADLVDHGRGVDLLVIGSREEAPVGQVMVSARARNEIESATAPVLVVARGVPLRFAVPATA